MFIPFAAKVRILASIFIVRRERCRRRRILESWSKPQSSGGRGKNTRIRTDLPLQNQNSEEMIRKKLGKKVILKYDNDAVFWGWFLMIAGSSSLAIFVYAAMVSKLLPSSPSPLIRAIQNDWYYCFLVPLTIPIITVAVYFHWLSMKLFKHA